MGRVTSEDMSATSGATAAAPPRRLMLSTCMRGLVNADYMSADSINNIMVSYIHLDIEYTAVLGLTAI